MKLKMIVLGLMIVATVILVGCQSNPNPNVEAYSKQNIDKIMGNIVAGKWTTQSSNGEVMVDLTPIEYTKGKLFVEISVNTHSVDDLNTYNLKEIITLQTESGEYKPIETPRLGGHHNGGELVFSVENEPKQFTITINDLHDKGTREFFWN